MYICMLGYTQIESLDRGAVFMSIPSEGQAAPMKKGTTAEAGDFACKSEAGPSENIRRTVTFFVERYQGIWGLCFRFSGTALAKRFFYFTQLAGEMPV